MNTATVVKAEFRAIASTEFTDLDIVPYSGSISETWKRTTAGTVATVNVEFKKENWSPENNTLMKSLVGRKAQFRVTDANGTVSLVGTNTNPARLVYSAGVEGQPTGFNGFACQISWLTPKGCEKT